ncbi:PREDICTED: branched-chain-amino-acid aminotransferase 1, mitochondrial isoform X2 [Tarenaya hassleriana]|uniref:branched-chain-amino-acid aminotransferase 1, mitochondrial isoform X1 n=1 Tax=Tarenaya hassleriana TaxID=28532 RepID=UPI00053C3098|nr:PREDICTED: branched-chain-amino-acid aminotransferase 1, mitochondrial isoform X1 [Tarenaya hassleriana]XP_010548662.1 PREDICTED: branched-chain-amino-acid aminotransferase 1, mitochondrial isoform X2 [Tarenaya hassleriana]
MGFWRLAQSSRVSSSFFKLRNYRAYGTKATASQQQQFPISRERDGDYADVDWDNLGFGLVRTDYMFITRCCRDGNFEQTCLSRYGNIEINPAAAVLNYGQGLLEGTKAYRREDGKILLFRPDQNAIRMKIGAERMCMPSPSVEQFVDAIRQTVLANKRWVPPPGKGSFYLRPLLFGSGPMLGVAPAPEYTFLVFGSPVQNYFKEGKSLLNLYVEEEVSRAFRGGTGSVKTIANYSPVLEPMRRAKERGFSDVLYLDAENRSNIEESSASNVFLVKGNVIVTPTTSGTILEGITRKSVIEIALDLGYEVEERPVSVDELKKADEVFCTGTAIGVASVGSITYQNKRTEFRVRDDDGLVAEQIRSALVGIQTGSIEDKKGWVLQID